MVVIQLIGISRIISCSIHIIVCLLNFICKECIEIVSLLFTIVLNMMIYEFHQNIMNIAICVIMMFGIVKGRILLMDNQ